MPVTSILMLLFALLLLGKCRPVKHMRIVAGRTFCVAGEMWLNLVVVAVQGQVGVGLALCLHFCVERTHCLCNMRMQWMENRSKEESENRQNCLETQQSPKSFLGESPSSQPSKMPEAGVPHLLPSHPPSLGPTGLSSTEPLLRNHLCPVLFLLLFLSFSIAF